MDIPLGTTEVATNKTDTVFMRRTTKGFMKFDPATETWVPLNGMFGTRWRIRDVQDYEASDTLASAVELLEDLVQFCRGGRDLAEADRFLTKWRQR